MSNINNDLNWLRLGRTRGIKKQMHKDILEGYNYDVEVILEKLPKMYNMHSSRSVLQIPSIADVQQEYEKTIAYKAFFVNPDNKYYPVLLKQIPDMPIILCAKGRIEILNQQNKPFAIIGSRKPSYHGIQMAKTFAEKIANSEIPIVSGLAKGIDAAAHTGAMLGGNTVGVIGSGINIQYPNDNKSLYQNMYEKQCIITELPFDVPPMANHFPERNRIISGMSNGVLIVEAGMASGSMQTARSAINYNRELYTIPGFPMDVRYKGNNHLIKNGMAHLVDSIDDLIQELQDNSLSFIREKNDILNTEKSKIALPTESEITDAKKTIINSLNNEGMTIDEICFATQINSRLCRISIIELEISDRIIRTKCGTKFVINYNVDIF